MQSSRTLYIAASDNGTGAPPINQGPPVSPPNVPPPQQAAPPDEPPVDEGGGGGDGGGFNFPHYPPMPPDFNMAPFELLATTVSPVMTPMYALCMVGGWRVPVNPYHYLCPPPAALAVYLYPIQYIEIQSRQYYRPPGPFLSVQPTEADVPDQCPKAYRKLKWKANLPVQERKAMFVVGEHVRAFDSSAVIPGCRWLLISMDATGILHSYPTKLVYESVEALKEWFLTHNRGAPENVVALYDQSKIPGVTPVVCPTGNWNSNWNPHLPPHFDPMMYGDFGDEDDEDD